MLLLVILISSMFYLHPEAVQAKNVIQINNIIPDVLEYPHCHLDLYSKVFLLMLAGKLGREKGDD